MSSRTSATWRTEIAAVGSSISTSLALESLVRAMATAWRWPPDIFFTRSRGRVSDLSSLKSCGGALDHGFLIENPEGPDTLVDFTAEKNILRGGQVVGKRQVLIDDFNALGARFYGLVEMADLAIDDDLAIGWRKISGDELDHGGFARAIVAHEAHDFTGIKRKTDIRQRMDRAKAF